MLAYASDRPIAGKRQSSPNAMLLIVSAHVALVAAVMSVRMDLPQRIKIPPTIIEFLPGSVEQQPAKPLPAPPRQTIMAIDSPNPNVPLPAADNPTADPSPAAVDPGPIAGGGTGVIPILPNPVVTPVRRDPRLLTLPSELKPPYPSSKLLSEEEAVLTLRLSIDEHGRVIAVDPVGHADGIFLDAARRYMMVHWRYQPAMQDGRAVASSLTVTLRFELDV